MQPLRAALSLIADGYIETDAVDLFGNWDLVGNARAVPVWLDDALLNTVWLDAVIDASRPLNRRPIPLFPGSVPPVWLESDWLASPHLTAVVILRHTHHISPWLEVGWLATLASAAVVYDTRPLCFGRMRMAARARDNGSA